MRKFKLLFLLLSCFCFTPAYTDNWKQEYWPNINWTQYRSDNSKVQLYATAFLRVYNGPTALYWHQVAENFAYRPIKNLAFELHYSYIITKPIGGSHFHNRNRLEFEINPSLPFDYVTINMRNRIELVKRQQINKIQTVYRPRIEFLFPIKNNPKIASIRCSEEIFYDLTTDRLTQSRFIPIGVDLKLCSERSLFLFLMLRNFFSADRWQRSFVLGSELRF